MKKKNAGDARESSGQPATTGDYEVKLYPLPFSEIAGPAVPFFVVAVLALVACFVIDQSDYPTIYSWASFTLFIAGVITLVALYICITTVLCPVCQRKCQSSSLPTGNQSARCGHCKIEWDTGMRCD